MMIAKLLSLLAIVWITTTSTVTLTLSISSKVVNALADYTWQLTFSAGTPRTNLTLTFPAPIAMTASTQFKYNNVNFLNPISGNTSLSASFLPTLNSTFTGTITMVVTNVRNPSSGITRNLFLVTTNSDSFLGLSVPEQITFESASFTSCPFTFNLCTEQANSELTVAVSLINPLITTNSRFLISYPFVWPGLSKGLGTDTSSLSICSVSIDGGATFNSTLVTCSIEKITANQITVFFPIDLTIAITNKMLVFKVGGVNAPPTQTISGASLRVATTDDGGNEIDSKSGCEINPVCITNLTNGQLTTTGLQVNSPYNRPDIKHNSYPLITVLGGDTMDVYYTPFSDLVGCNTFKYWRVPSGTSGMMTTSIVATGTNFYNFTVQPAAYLNSDTTNPVFVSIQCTSFKMPVSETPANLTFRFRRAGIQYFELNTTIQAVAIEANFTQAILYVNQLEMGMITSYQFTIKLGQPLGSTPRIVLSFPTDIGISGTSYSVSLSTGVSATISSFIIDPILNTVGLSITAGSTLIQSTNITITVNGITNAKVPTIYYIGFTTYYDALTTSKVQYNNTAFNATFTAVTTTTVTLLPSSMTVYTLTPTTISFTNTINLPAASIILLQFPTNVTLLQVSATPFAVNGSNVSIIGTPSTTSNTLTFTTSQLISIGSSIIISLSVRTPTIMSNYSFVKLTISKGGVSYLLSHNTMQLIVDTVASQALTLVPQLAKAGASSAYLFTLTLSIPHPATFTVVVEVPTDVNMTPSAAICSINCSGSVAPVSKTFSFIVTNTNANSATPVNVAFLVSNFTNPRSTGTGLPWTLTTLDSLGGNIISKQSATPFISLPNSITASLSLNEEYYRSNTNSIKIRMTFYNQLISTDYILLTMDTTTYSQNTIINCSNSLGICTKHLNSTTGLLIIQVVPVLNQIINGTYDLILEGLISGANTGYMQTDFITARTYTSAGLMMDNGTMPYNISCRESSILSKSCRRCSSTSCIDCYVVSGFYLNGTTCVTSCGDATKFMSFANVSNGTCQTCINNCATCTSSTVCVTCLNTSSYYLYTDDFSCKLMCNNISGYVASTLDNRPICSPCFDAPLCLECSSTASGACTKCVSNSFLVQGSCLSSCSSPMLYNSNGTCLPCNTSCSTCSGPGNTGCTLCAVGYVNSTGKCLSSCEAGKAITPSTNLCGCDPSCSTCETTNYYACTQCATFGQFVWQGKCIPTCPNATYKTTIACIACSIGCANCSSTTCSACENGWLLYNNYCVTDCNLISQQYDQQGLTCVLCPEGCDSCSGVACKSCLSGYSLSGNQCVKTCLLFNNCDVGSNQVLPLPGFISLVLWTAIVLIIRFISHKNYVPYSIILFSCVIEYILVIALLGVTDSAVVVRLLAGFSYAYRNTMKILLVLSIIFNYLSNAAYIFIFIRYLRPLMNNPKQIDFIANVVVLVVAGLTNYRFALIAFARMFPKPNIYAQNASKLTPVHYLCICSIILDLFSIVAGGLGVYNEQPKTDMFMLSLDLLIIIAVNIAISIWFVSSTKPEDYFEDDVKKYHIEEHNVTGETLPNEKGNSKANMIANESINFYDDDFVEQAENSPDKSDSYKKIRAQQIKIQQKEHIPDFKDNEIRKSGKNSSQGLNSSRLPRKIIREQPTKDEPNNINIKNSEANKAERFDPESDVNFEKNLKPRKGMSNSAQKMNMSTAALNTEPKNRQNSPSSKGKSIPISMKESVRSDRKREELNKNIEEAIQQSDIPDMQQNSDKDGRQSVFQKKQKLIRPKRVGTQKALTSTKKKQLGKSLEDPKKMMKKEKRIGYFESDAFESNAEVDDLEAIIKQKVFQSTMKLEKPKELSHESNEQTGYEEISPSWYNIQNQRLDVSDMDDAESQQ